MRIPAYLTTSRHNVFYFRWSIPKSTHPDRKTNDRAPRTMPLYAKRRSVLTGYEVTLSWLRGYSTPRRGKWVVNLCFRWISPLIRLCRRCRQPFQLNQAAHIERQVLEPDPRLGANNADATHPGKAEEQFRTPVKPSKLSFYSSPLHGRHQNRTNSLL